MIAGKKTIDVGKAFYLPLSLEEHRLLLLHRLVFLPIDVEDDARLFVVVDYTINVVVVVVVVVVVRCSHGILRDGLLSF